MSNPEDFDPRAPGASDPAGEPTSPAQSRTQEFVSELAAGFRTQVERALGTELHEGEVALAYVDHYLRLGQDEDRDAIVWLLAAGAGAYFGELIRREIGATWVGDGKDPRRLRLLLAPQLVHLAPVDMAFAAVAGVSDDAEIERQALDTAFHFPNVLDPPQGPDTGDEENARTSDAHWIRARLEELPPLPEEQFVSLTGRFETLRLILGLLAERHAGEGRDPKSYGLGDYLGVLGASSV